jgi:DNA repair photolyase
MPRMWCAERASVRVLSLPALRVGGLRVTLSVLGVRKRGVEFLERRVHSVLNPPESTRLGFWSLNPYMGCEFGCTYCYARFAHAYGIQRAEASGALPAETRRRLAAVNHPWQTFERAIFVKRGFEDALARDLRRVVRRGGRQAIAVGTATDPYQPAERMYRLTRRALETFAAVTAQPGLRISIVTKSPLVTRDTDVLRRLAARHQVAVHLSIVTIDPAIIRLLEPRSPLPHTRLRAVRQLADAGVAVGIFCAPVLPGITDDVRTLRELFRAASDMGAQFAPGCALRVYGGAREPLLHALERSLPRIAARYRQRYRRAREAPDAYRKALSARMRRLRNEMGLQPAAFEEEGPLGEQQMTLWG